MTIEITMPALSPTMTEGTLAKLVKGVGDSVAAGEVIAEIETDKATMEVEAVDEGVLGKIIVAEGSEGVAVNAVIAVLLEDGETADDIGEVSSAPAAVAADAPKEVTPVEANKPAAAPVVASSNKGDRIFASPLAKRIAADKGIDLGTVKGSGPRGRIVKVDVENAKAGGAVAPSVSAAPQMLGDATYTAIPNNNIKKITAKRLLESKTTVPHFYLTVDCQLDNLLAARKGINEAANGDYKVSVNDFIIKAVAMAMKAYPAVNCLLYTSPSPRDRQKSRMPSSA